MPEGKEPMTGRARHPGLGHSTLVVVVTVLLSWSYLRPSYGQGQSAGPPSETVRSLSAQEVARRALPAVVLLVCDNGENGTQASGFFVRPGVLVTNYHVIEGMGRGTARTVAGTGSNVQRTWRIAEILAVDETSDLAILSVPDAVSERINPLQVVSSIRDAKVGDTVYALGNPEGLSGTLSAGILSAGLRYIDGKPRCCR